VITLNIYGNIQKTIQKTFNLHVVTMKWVGKKRLN